MADDIVMVNGLPRLVEDSEEEGWSGGHVPKDSQPIRDVSRILHKIACDLDTGDLVLSLYDFGEGSIWYRDTDGNGVILKTGKMRMVMQLTNTKVHDAAVSSFASADIAEYMPETLPGRSSNTLPRIRAEDGAGLYNILDDVSRLLSDDHDEG